MELFSHFRPGDLSKWRGSSWFSHFCPGDGNKWRGPIGVVFSFLSRALKQIETIGIVFSFLSRRLKQMRRCHWSRVLIFVQETEANGEVPLELFSLCFCPGDLSKWRGPIGINFSFLSRRRKQMERSYWNCFLISPGD